MKKFVFFASLVVVLIACFNGCSSAEKTGGNIHLQEGRFDRAIQQYKVALKEYPNDSDLYVGIAIANFMKKDYREAIVNLETANNMNEKGVEGNFKKYEGLLNTKYLKWQIYYNGSVEYSKDDLTKGIELAKKALEVDDPKKVSQSYNLLANLVLKEGKDEEAKGYLMKAIEADKSNIQAYMTLGHSSLAQRDVENAVKYFNEALKVDSSKIEIYELIGQAYLVKAEYDKAIKSLEKALSITGKNPSILYNLMVANYQAGNYDETISKGKEVLALENVDNSIAAKVYNLIGQSYQEKKDYKSVVAVIEEAINKGVNNCDSYSLIAHAYYKLGKTKTSSNYSKKWEECEKNK